MTDKFEAAREVLHEQNVACQTKLDSLFAAYEKLGGTYEDETAEAEAEAEPEIKRLTGPKEKKKQKKRKAAPPVGRDEPVGVTINGKAIALKPKAAAVIELMLAAENRFLATADIVQVYGDIKPFQQSVKRLREALAPAGVDLVNVPWKGYRLEKLK